MREGKEYPEFTEPQHILQDAMSQMSKWKDIEGLVLGIGYTDKENKSCYSTFVCGSTPSQIGLCHLLKKEIDNVDT